MTTYILRRILISLPIILVITVIVFLLANMMPGDAVMAMISSDSPMEADLIKLRQGQLGLDLPLHEQYLAWLGGLLRLDLGQDFVSHVPLTDLLAERLPVTLELTFLAMGLALLVGIPAGVIAATRSRRVKRTSTALVVAGISIPDFWLGIMLVLLFAGTLRWLPPSGYTPFFEDPVANLRYMILPVVTLAVGEAAYLLRTTRGAMEETLGSPYVTFLRARGVPERRIVVQHALRNAAVPIVTVVGIQLGVLLGGAIVVEALFALPGVGRMIVTGINQRNYPVVQAGVLAVAVLFILLNLVTDLLYGRIDPRLADADA